MPDLDGQSVVGCAPDLAWVLRTLKRDLDLKCILVPRKAHSLSQSQSHSHSGHSHCHSNSYSQCQSHSHSLFHTHSRTQDRGSPHLLLYETSRTGDVLTCFFVRFSGRGVS